MFQLEKQRCTISHINVRDERHGDEYVTAVDIDIKADVDSEILDAFAHGMVDAFYAPAELAHRQPGLAGVIELREKRAVRFPGVIEGIRVHTKISGYRAELTRGDLFESTNFFLEDCVVHKFSVVPKTGGNCDLSLQLQCRPDAPTIGELALLLRREVVLNLTPPVMEGTTTKESEPDETVHSASEAR